MARARPSASVPAIGAAFPETYRSFRAFARAFDPLQVDRQAFEAYSAREVTRQLAVLLDQVADGHPDKGVTA